MTKIQNIFNQILEDVVPTTREVELIERNYTLIILKLNLKDLQELKKPN
jgi:hypothetical protein